VRRKLIASFPGADLQAQREEDTLHIYHQSPNDKEGAIYLIASFEGSGFVAENEDDGVVVYLISAESISTTTVGDHHGVVLGRPGPKVAAAMRSGKTMSAERLQALNEAARRGEKPTTIKDRTPNPRAVDMQRANEKLRGEWK